MENTIIIRGGLLFHVLLLSLMILVDQFQGGKATSSSSNVDRREEQEKDRVVDLPGVFFNVSFAHYSGYVSVNENSGRSLFYWFFEAVEDPSSKPLVIWLQGGPGCSSIGFGEAEEIGPFHVNASGKTLYLNPHSWNQEANIIFLDSPVGAGFSYSKNPLDVLENGDKRTAEDSLIFLLKWFERFPQYKGRDFYITGESYADHCQKISDVVQDELGKIDIYSIFTPFCTTIGSNVSYSNEPLKGNNIRTRLINEKYDPCTKKYSAVYFNIPEVQKALHVDPEAAPSKWEICSDLIFHNWKDSASSVLDIYRELIAAGLRIWMFSGDTDTVIPVTSTRYNLEALKLPTASPWHPWSVDGQVGGWNQQYIGLNFVTVRGAGHKVPLTRPKQALVLFKSFLSGSPLPRSSGSAALNV